MKVYKNVQLDLRQIDEEMKLLKRKFNNELSYEQG